MFNFAKTLYFAQDAVGAYHREDYARAKESWGKVLEIDPNDTDGLRGRGLASLRLSELENAVEDLTGALQAEPADAEALAGRVEALFWLSQYEPALEDAVALIKADAQNLYGHYMFGMCLMRLDRYAESLVPFDRVLKADPLYEAAWSGRGEACYLLGRFDEALAHLNRAIELDPTRNQSWATRGDCLYSLSRLDDALADFVQLAKQAPRDWYGWMMAAKILYLQDRFPESLDCQNKCMEIETREPGMFQMRGTLLGKLGDHEGAAAAYAAAARMAADDADYALSYAQALRRLNRFREAVAEYDRALRIHPEHVPLHAGRGYALRAAGDTQGSQAAFRRAAQAHAQYVRQVAATGIETVAVVVQANEEILQPGEIDRGCFALVTFDERVEDPHERLLPIAKAMMKLKGLKPAAGDERFVAEMVTNEAGGDNASFNRRRLPTSFTGGIEVLYVSLDIPRLALRAGYLTEKALPCYAERGATGRVVVKPFWFKG